MRFFSGDIPRGVDDRSNQNQYERGDWQGLGQGLFIWVSAPKIRDAGSCRSRMHRA